MDETLFNEIQLTVLVCLAQRLGVNKDTIAYEDRTEVLSKGNKYAMGHVMMDVHELLGIKTIDYPAYQEFELFKTVEDIIKYFYTTIKEGQK